MLSAAFATCAPPGGEWRYRHLEYLLWVLCRRMLMVGGMTQWRPVVCRVRCVAQGVAVGITTLGFLLTSCAGFVVVVDVVVFVVVVVAVSISVSISKNSK